MDLIASIRRNHGLDLIRTNEDSEAGVAVRNLQANLSNALYNLSEELYTKDTHFVMEFVQNADDNSYADNVCQTAPGPSLELALYTKRRIITIFCNEEGFSDANVKAICSIGASTKSRQEGYIGEKGIGFKSVFTIAQAVSVFSNSFSFKFDTCEHLGMIAPTWISDDQRLAMTGGYDRERRGTIFVLEVLPSVDIEELSSKLAVLDASLLLFLRQLRYLELRIDSVKYKFTRQDFDDGTVVLNSGDRCNTYYVVKSTVRTYLEEIKRPNVSTSEILLAFPLQENGEPLIEMQNVHAFLPLRPYGFSFIIQADFLTTSNREDILSNRPWNIVLRDAICSTFHTAMTRFKGLPQLCFNWIQYIPLYIPDPFMQYVAIAIKESVYLLATNGQEYKACQLLIVPPEYRMPDGEPIIPDSCLEGGYFYLAHEYDAVRDQAILAYLGVGTMVPHIFVSALGTMDRLGYLETQTTAWFEHMSHILLYTAYAPMFQTSLRSLRLIPIEGSDSRVSADTCNLFFGTGLSDVPADLQLKMVDSSIGETSSQYGLFWNLGIRPADTNRIVILIMERHKSVHWTSGTSAPLEHAMFLFHHASSMRTILNFKVLCSGGQVRLATDVYMEWPYFNIPSGLRLGTLFPHPGAAHLHSSYYQPAVDGWFDWLLQTVKINIHPRIVNNSLSPEFAHFVKTNAGSDKLLEALHFYWAHIDDKIPDDCQAAQDLAKASVRCKDGSLRPLGLTFVEVRALRQFKNLPFLALPHGDQEDAGWRFLARLGVSFSVDSMFYMKRLREISGREVTEDTASDVAELYAQISARFDDSDPVAIRKAFREHCLVFVPPKSRFTSSFKNPWIPWEKICWSGPRSVTHSKIVLSTMDLYRPLEKLFKHQLLFPDCAPNILLQEMRLLTQLLKNKSLDDADHQRVFLVLRDIDDVIKKRQKTGEAVSWLEDLRRLPMFPAQMPAGYIKLYDIAKIYNPGGNTELAALFGDRVPLLAVPAGSRLELLQDLLQSEVCRGLKTLTESVVIRVHASGRSKDIYSSKFYSSRFEFLKRLSLARSGSESPLVGVRKIFAYRVKELRREQTLKSESIVLESKCTAAVLCEEESGVMVLRILRRGVYAREAVDLDVAQELAGHLNLDLMAIYSLLSPQVPPAALEQMLRQQNIGQLADLAPEADNVPLETVEAEPTTNLTTATPIDAIIQARTERPRALSAVLSGSIESHSGTDQGAPRPIPGIPMPMQEALNEVDPNLCSPSGPQISGSFHANFRYPEGQPQAAELWTPPYLAFTALPGSDTDHSQTALHLMENVPHNDESSGPASTPQSQTECTAEEYIMGILGEHIVYKELSLILPEFNEENWTSELRHHVPQFTPYTGTSLADFVYPDISGKLTELIFQGRQRLIEAWRNKWPTFYLEVKTTGTGNKHAPFAFRRQQLLTASRMAIRDPDHPPPEVYVLVRVWNEPSRGICFKAFPDPHTMIYNGTLRAVSTDLYFEIGAE